MKKVLFTLLILLCIQVSAEEKTGYVVKEATKCSDIQWQYLAVDFKQNLFTIYSTKQYSPKDTVWKK